MKTNIWYLITSVWAGAFALWSRSSGMEKTTLLSFGAAMVFLGMAVQDLLQRGSLKQPENGGCEQEQR